MADLSIKLELEEFLGKISLLQYFPIQYTVYCVGKYIQYTVLGKGTGLCPASKF